MDHRVITVRLAAGDAGGVTAVVRIRRGDGFATELTLHPGAPSATFAYDVETDEIGNGAGLRAAGRSYAYEIEYRWGYAREASRRGESDADELILPFPGSTGHASFPFRQDAPPLASVPPAQNRRMGIFLMLGAGLCWSLGGIIVRKLTLTDVWEVVFWRALFMAAFIGTLLSVSRGRGTLANVRAIGGAGLLSGVCIAAQMIFFILALSHTTAANTFALMSVSPLLAALVGVLFLRERVGRFTWFAIAIALGGIALMFGEGLGTGRWLGNLFALCVPLGYALQILFLRKVRGHAGKPPDLLPALFAGAVIAMLPTLFLGWPLEASMRDLSLLLVMGCVQLGVGCWLMTLAVPHLRAAEMGLLALADTILAPLWVWLGTGEAPSGAALAGGALIVGALAANGWVTLRAERAG